MKSLVALLAHLVVLQTAPATATCYYPNGGVAKYDVPCDPEAEVSACCGAVGINGYACLTNNLCKGADGKIIRGTCTDQSWNSPDCPHYCERSDWDNNGHDLVSCQNVTNNDLWYCCSGVDDCCDSGVGRFTVQPSNPQTWALWDNSKSAYVVKTPRPTSTTTTSSSSTTSSSATTTAGGSDGASATSSTPGTGGLPSQTSSANNQAEPVSAQSSGLSTGAKAGIGVGAAVGALLVAAVAYLWWKLNKVQREHQQYAGGEVLPPTMPYYPQAPPLKTELPSEPEAHELQAGHYPAGVEAEMDGSPAWSPAPPPSAHAYSTSPQ